MRLVVFTDVNGWPTASFIDALVDLCRRRDDLCLAGFVTTRPEVFRPSRGDQARDRLRRLLIAATNPGTPLRTVLGSRLNLLHRARREGVPVLVPPQGDVNAPEFVREMRAELRPDVSLTFYGQQIYRKPLRAAFAQSVNYHDGRLPEYRGVVATSFSIFAGESESGLSFHRVNAKIDGGPVLATDAVPIDETSRLDEVSRRKHARALALMPRVLTGIVGSDPGRPQSGTGRYYSMTDWQAMIHLPQPEELTRAEIERRIRAFGLVHLTIDGIRWPATRVRPTGTVGPRTFRTGDGILLVADRLLGLPARLYRMGTFRFLF